MKSPTSYSPIRKRKEQMLLHLLFLMKCGNVLLSHTVSRTVPSALCGLTSVFGMRTGGSHMILSPQWYIMPCAPLTLATGVRFAYTRSPRDLFALSQRIFPRRREAGFGVVGFRRTKFPDLFAKISPRLLLIGSLRQTALNIFVIQFALSVP